MAFQYQDSNGQILQSIPDTQVVTISNSVTEILSNACKNSETLQTISFESGSQLITLNHYSFTNSKVQNIDMRECLSLTSLAQWCFRECKALVSIELPQNGHLSVVHQGAFAYCSSLEEILFPSSLEHFDDCTFNDGAIFHRCTSLRRVIFPEKSMLKHLGGTMFWSCSSLDHFFVPKHIHYLPRYIFESCTSLKEIIFLSSHPSFGENIFRNIDPSKVHCYVASHATKDEFMKFGVPSHNIIFISQPTKMFSCSVFVHSYLFYAIILY